MQIIRTILTSSWFSGKPPVLIDIGASGEINPRWKLIAPYSVCIAFDADDREFKITEETGKTYHSLITVNRIVTATPVAQTDFHLTESPFCSSLLAPETAKLQPWLFSQLFNLQKKTSLPAITISQALQEKGINYIDWFKTDTQGTDLRLFKSLPQNIAGTVLAAEFEPGIIDAYEGEDKLYQVMEHMHAQQFWLSSMHVKGSHRLSYDYGRQLGAAATRTVKKSPGWAEVVYLRSPSSMTERQLLLLYIFALIEKQYGFALEIADHALKNFNDDIFRQCRLAVLSKLNAEKWKVPLVIFKRQLNKLFAGIND